MNEHKATDLSDDLSDEACEQWRCYEKISVGYIAKRVWTECRRRAEAMLEGHRNQYDKDLMSLQMEIVKLKERERKAFEAGCVTGAKMVYCDDQAHRIEVKENDYRAYQAEGSGKE